MTFFFWQKNWPRPGFESFDADRLQCDFFSGYAGSYASWYDWLPRAGRAASVQSWSEALYHLYSNLTWNQWLIWRMIMALPGQFLRCCWYVLLLSLSPQAARLSGWHPSRMGRARRALAGSSSNISKSRGDFLMIFFKIICFDVPLFNCLPWQSFHNYSWWLSLMILIVFDSFWFLYFDFTYKSMQVVSMIWLN